MTTAANSTAATFPAVWFLILGPQKGDDASMIGVPRQLATAEQGPIPGPLARPAQQRSALIRAHAEHPYTSWQRALKKPRRILKILRGHRNHRSG